MRNGLRARKVRIARTPAPIVRATTLDLACPHRTGRRVDRQEGPGRQDEPGQRSVQLGEGGQPAEEARAPQVTQGPPRAIPIRDGPGGRFQAQRPQASRRQDQRLGRDVGHRAAGVHRVERVGHQEERGQEADPAVEREGSQEIDRDAADRPEEDRGTAGGDEGLLADELAAGVGVPGPHRGRTGAAKPFGTEGEADQVFRQRREVITGIFEPGRIVAISGQDQVGEIRLGNISRFVHEVGLGPQVPSKDAQGDDENRGRSRELSG